MRRFRQAQMERCYIGLVRLRRLALARVVRMEGVRSIASKVNTGLEEMKTVTGMTASHALGGCKK